MQVTFNDNVKVINLHTWALAYHLARKADWAHVVADRARFQNRIRRTEEILSPILTTIHRNKIFNMNNGHNKNQPL